MAINPPWRLDPWQIIVNVNFGGPATFVAIDSGGFAFSTANTSPSLLDPNPAGNYPGGYNVFSSSDGINWTIQRQGVVDANPSALAATTKDAGALTVYNGTMTISTSGFTGTLFLAVISEVAGDGPPPPALLDGKLAGPPVYNSPPDVLPFWSDTETPLLFQYGVTGQTSFASAYNSFWNGSPDFITIAPTATWHMDTEIVQTVHAWNFTDGPLEGIDGITEYMMSSSIPTRTFVIGANGNNGGSGYTVPVYFRSTDGIRWTQFTPPFNPTDPWFPYFADVWFDDGTQRTRNIRLGHFDGEPTYLWISSNGNDGDPVYVSSDGCVTWTLDTRHKFGLNGSGNTDDVYVGDPNNSYEDDGSEIGSNYGAAGESGGPSTNLWTVVYGSLNGHMMGVQIRSSDIDTGPDGGPNHGFGLIRAGPAEDDPSTWPSYHLPEPPNAVMFAAAGSALDLENYNLEYSQFTEDLRGATAELGALQELYAWAFGASAPFVINYTYYVALYEELVSAIEDAIAGLPPAPGPRVTTPQGLYVAYAVPPGATEGIFVCVGASATQNSDGDNITGRVPCFWYSKDAMTWQVANYDYDYTSDMNNGTDSVQGFGMLALVAGNTVDQIFAAPPS